MAARKTTRKPHDMGGDAAGPVDRHEHTPTMAERRIDAMMLLLRKQPRAFWVTDENRRTIESLSPETYRDAAYYEKWCLAMRSLLIEKGVLTPEEIDAKLADVRARHGAGGATRKAAAKRGAKAAEAKPKAAKKVRAKAAAQDAGPAKRSAAARLKQKKKDKANKVMGPGPAGVGSRRAIR